jgi:PHD/YefM family antitoxin component YafN of YafNO toxin-antitoxin module
MTAIEALQSVQFITSRGNRFAVIGAEDWEALIEWLETLEDLEIVRKAFDDLKAAGGDRKKAGWIEWEKALAEL